MRALACCLVITTLCATGPGWADDKQKVPPSLDEETVKTLRTRYAAAKHWGVKAVVLNVLGPRWHPSGAALIEDALESGDRRLVAYAIEALRRCDDEWLKPCTTRRMIAWLVTHGVTSKYIIVRDRCMALMTRLAPFADAQDKASVQKWWKAVGEKYVPPPLAKEIPRAGSVEVDYRKEQIDTTKKAEALGASGLEVVICIDSTASMQDTIWAARKALRELVAILRGIVPGLRMGLVTYKDTDEIKEGAKILVKLTEKTRNVEAALAVLRAKGGGDWPERVVSGLVMACSKEMGWVKTATKVVILVGDAPPPDDRLDMLVNLVRQARYGVKPPETPWTISAVNAGPSIKTEKIFKYITKVAGGTYQRLRWPKRGVKMSVLNNPVLAQLVQLSLGPLGKRATPFIQTYREYRDAKFLE